VSWRAVASGARVLTEVIFGEDLLEIVTLGVVLLTAIAKEEVLCATIEAEAKVLIVVVLIENVVDTTMVATEPLSAKSTGLFVAVAVVKEGETLEMAFGKVPLKAVPTELVLFAIFVVERTGLLELAALVLVALGMTASGADTLGAIDEGVVATIVVVEV
jgi:hypothetical protein